MFLTCVYLLTSVCVCMLMASQMPPGVCEDQRMIRAYSLLSPCACRVLNSGHQAWPPCLLTKPVLSLRGHRWLGIQWNFSSFPELRYLSLIQGRVPIACLWTNKGWHILSNTFQMFFRIKLLQIFWYIPLDWLAQCKVWIKFELRTW